MGAFGIIFASLAAFVLLMLLRVDLALQPLGLERPLIIKGFSILEHHIGAFEVGMKIAITRVLPLGLWFWVAGDFLSQWLPKRSGRS